MRPHLACLLLTAFALVFGAPAAHALPGALDPRLTPLLAPGVEPAPVWVEFLDKGEQGPADLAARLAAAEAAMTPENRRRRERAHVRPLVDWLDLPLEPAYVEALRARGLAPYGASRWFNRVAVRASGATLLELAALPFVRHIAAVELAAPRTALPPQPPASGPREAFPAAAHGASGLVDYGQTGTQLARLNVPALHDSGYTGAGVNICVLDAGFNWYQKHEALRPMIVGRNFTRDFIRGVTSVQDTLDNPGWFEHGTGVLSVLGGRKPGVYVGPAFGANYFLGRTEDVPTEKPIEMVYWAMGAEWADSLGADLLQSSLGYTLFPDSAGTDITYAMRDGHTTIATRAAEIAAAKGILVVVSAGNDGFQPGTRSKISVPADANGDSVLTVGAVDSLGRRATFSSKGPTADGRVKPDLMAQGVDVIQAYASSDPQGYVRGGGTSYAAPLVAGLAACLLQARPAWRPVWVIEALKRTASRASAPDTLFGYGLPDGAAALLYVPDTSSVPRVSGPLRLAFAGRNPLPAGTAGGTFRFAVGAEHAGGRYRLRLFDAAGRQVRDLGSGTLTPGTEGVVPWQGEDAHGRALVPGIYMVSLEMGGSRVVRRVAVLR